MSLVGKSRVSFFRLCGLVIIGFSALDLGAQAATIFFADFEDGVGGYSSDGFTYATDTATSNLWHATTHRAVSPTHCQYYGLEGVYNYDTGAQNAGNLVSPMISFEGVTAPITLSFKYLLQTENFPGFDLATVEINAPGSGGWVTLATLSDSPSFTTSNIDLSAYAGLPCFIRFKFDTIDNLNNSFEGWYIDDVSITGTIPVTNSWINSSSGKWETAVNWSVGTPSVSDLAELITNANTKTVTIDPTTTLSNSLNQCLSINNLIISAPAGTVNTLQLANPGTSIPLKISNALTLNSGGAILVTNFALQVGGLTSVGASGSGTLTLQSGTVTLSNNLVLGTSAGATGTVWVTSALASLVATNSGTALGASGNGQMTVSNGTVLAREILLGSNTFSTGTLTVTGGSVVMSNLAVAVASNSVGTVWVKDGFVSMTTSNRSTSVGRFGAGQIIQSNGTFILPIAFVGTGIGGVGTVTVAGGTMQWVGSPVLSSASNSVGTLWLTGGQILGNVSPTIFHKGSITVSNGLMRLRDLVVASTGESVGTLTVAGGTLSMDAPFTSNLVVASGNNSTASVWVTGGQLLATNNNCLTYLGQFGSGQATVSNGSVLWGTAYVGFFGPGTLTTAGGSVSVLGDLTVGILSNGSVWVSGGQLSVPNGTVRIGNLSAPSQMTVSGGVVMAKQMYLSSNVLSRGSLTLPGGQVTVSDRLVVGDCGNGAPGQITLNGGQLYVTNASHTAVLNLLNGTITVSSGLLVADKLVMTNMCGLFSHTGGTISVSNLVLDPNLSASGDSLPNWWKQQYGLDPFSSNGVNGINGDPDGDGISNGQEYFAGTDPTNNASGLRIASLIQTGNDMRVTWKTTGGHVDVVRAAPAIGSSYSNISPTITIVGSGDVTTNYLDIGGATNSPSRFYRVGLAQPTPDHFSISAIGGPVTSGVPFTITITALDATNGVLTGFSDSVALGTTNSVGGVFVTPKISPLFTAGQWTGPVTVSAFSAAGLAITATDNSGRTGQSNPFYAQRPASSVLVETLNTPADMVADSSRGLLYITVGSQVWRYDLVNGLYLPPFDLGGTLEGVDISPDNSTLVVADSTFGGGSNWVYVVDLTTGTSHKATFPLAFAEAGTWAVAFGSDGAALFTSEFQGSGWTPMRRYDPVAGTFTTVANPRHRSMVSSSGDGRTMIVSEADSSPAPVDHYNVISQTISGSTSVAAFLFEGAVNRDGTQFAAVGSGGTFLLNSNLTQLGAVATSIGVAYHPQADLAFFALSSSTNLQVLETRTMTVLTQYDCGDFFPSLFSNTQAFQPGRVRTSRDGNNIFVTIYNGVRWISRGAGLPTDLRLNQTPSASPVRVGTNLTFTIAVTNSGPNSVADAQVLDRLPSGATFVSATASQGTCAQSSGLVTATLGAIASGNAATVNIVVTSPIPAVLTNLATVLSSAVDSNPSNNASVLAVSAQTSIPPALVITSPSDNSYVTVSPINVIGTSASPSGVATVTVNNAVASTADGYTNWIATVGGLALGTNLVTVIATDNYAPPDVATNFVHVIYVTGSYDGNGDGLPDAWQVQYFGCVDCPQAAPGSDLDGDGFTDLQEYLTGTDPTNGASAFRISAIAREGNDLRVTWTTGPGKTNALQLATGDGNGGYSTNYNDIFTVTNTVGFSTNYLDVGSATNLPARYYRARLVP